MLYCTQNSALLSIVHSDGLLLLYPRLLDLPDSKGTTALHSACLLGHFEVEKRVGEYIKIVPSPYIPLMVERTLTLSLT